MERSLLYTGVMSSELAQPLHPSIETKVMRFADKTPASDFMSLRACTQTKSVQGMSSCLPEDVQIALTICTVPGMEKVEFMHINTAYAIEYISIYPTYKVRRGQSLNLKILRPGAFLRDRSTAYGTSG